MTDEIVKNEQVVGELEDLRKKSDEYLNNWKRSAADFANYKKEEMERMAFLAKYSKEDMILKVLPILDHIYMAGQQLPENLKIGKEGSREAIEWTKGFLQIQKQAEEFLKKEGVEEIVVKEKEFDPTTMEVIGESETGKLEEIQKGYVMDGKVLRPARVKISK